MKISGALSSPIDLSLNSGSVCAAQGSCHIFIGSPSSCQGPETALQQKATMIRGLTPFFPPFSGTSAALCCPAWCRLSKHGCCIFLSSCVLLCGGGDSLVLVTYHGQKAETRHWLLKTFSDPWKCLMLWTCIVFVWCSIPCVSIHLYLKFTLKCPAFQTHDSTKVNISIAFLRRYGWECVEGNCLVCGSHSIVPAVSH